MQPVWLYAIFLLVIIWVGGLSILVFKLWKSVSLSKQRDTSRSPSQLFFSIIKYNAFADTGGDQSFVLSLLNEQKSGVVITSLHGRDFTRLYAKKILHGQSDQPLSKEEAKALSQSQELKQ